MKKKRAKDFFRVMLGKDADTHEAKAACHGLEVLLRCVCTKPHWEYTQKAISPELSICKGLLFLLYPHL